MNPLQLCHHIFQLSVVLKVRPSKPYKVIRGDRLTQYEPLEPGVLTQSLSDANQLLSSRGCHESLTSSTSLRPTVFGIDLKKICERPGSNRFSTGRNTL